MDDRENNSSRSGLYQPFLNAANALASLYKQAMTLEKEGRDSGLRLAYQHIMQWAARKSRSGDQITAAELITLCAKELANLPPPSTTTSTAMTPLMTGAATSSRNVPNVISGLITNGNQGNGQGSDMVPEQPGGSAEVAAPGTQTTPAYVARDDGLISDIHKLNVNPRKRQRVDINEAFTSAFRSMGNPYFSFLDDCNFRQRSPEQTSSPHRVVQMEGAFSGSRQTSNNSSRRESRDSRDSRDGRDIGHGDTQNPPVTRSARGSKGHWQEKARKK